MIVFVAITAMAAMSLLLIYLGRRRRHSVRQQAIATMVSSGIATDDDGNINAGLTYASMRAREEISGIRYSGSEGEFLQLMRMVSEGPRSIDEIRFLLEKGFEPVVRPDGQVYVPCIENEHLSVDGEISLCEEDLDRIEERSITGCSKASP